MTDDTISRQAAIDTAEWVYRACEGNFLYYHDLLVAALMDLPSAQPQRIKGRWIDDGLYSDNFPHHAWRCSECEECVIEIDEPWFEFCPNCGADMRGDHDE